ncbi:hypothetical protein AHAS_Ahas20G0204800 [Arachis hypogaea]
MRVITHIRLVCILEWFLLIIHWWRLLPWKLIKCLRLLPPLVVPSLMHVTIVISISYNIVRTKLIAKRMRIHSVKRK